MKYAFCQFLVFTSGGIVFGHLRELLVNEPLEASWTAVVGTSIFAIFFSIIGLDNHHSNQ